MKLFKDIKGEGAGRRGKSRSGRVKKKRSKETRTNPSVLEACRARESRCSETVVVDHETLAGRLEREERKSS